MVWIASSVSVMFEVLSETDGFLYPIIGNPIEQVKSPDLFNQYFYESGLEARMVAIKVASSELGIFFNCLRNSKRARGCVVTVPHKNASVPYMDQLSDRSKQLGALNVVQVENGCLSGDMVDGLGFLAAIRNHGFSCQNKSLGIVGLGAAGAAIAHAAASSGARTIAIQELDLTRLAFAKESLVSAFPKVDWTFEIAALENFDLIVNASPVGMNGDPRLPIPLDSVRSDCLIMDLVTKPKITPWLKTALGRGCEVVFGSEMVRGQFRLMGQFMGLEIPET